MRRRYLILAAALLALPPIAAHADDTSTAVTETATSSTDSPTMLVAPLTVAAPVVDLLSQTKALSLIDKRVAKLDVSSRSGEIAMNEDGSLLWEQRSGASLMPASTMKVITAIVALDHYGGAWRPRTTVEFDTRTGTLALVAGGDPQLTSAQLGVLADRTVESLTALAVNPSRITVDDSLFQGATLQPGVLAGQQPSEERPIRALVLDQSRSMDTALEAGRAFRTLLAERGVLLPFKGRASSTGEELAAVSGYRLQSTLQAMLWYSDNDIAEMVFRMSAIAEGRAGTWEEARSTAVRTLKTLGVDTTGVKLVDGSGLSRINRLTPRAIAQALQAATHGTRTGQLRSLLPAAGVNGTLRTRYSTPPSKCVRGLLKAKTGSLHDVIALAGYAPTASEFARPFAFIINGVPNSASARNRTRSYVDILAAAVSGC